jgi:hypothetical protein
VHTARVTAAVSFVWLGMVLAISFLETPLKFRAPGMTTPLGLAVGRVVFGALNKVEVGLLLVLIATVVAAPRAVLIGLTGVLAVVLAVQLGAVRPVLSRRSDRVLAGEELPRSRGHLVYVALEVVKAVLLAAAGWLSLE